MKNKDPQEEWEEDAEFSILDGSRYFVDGPNYKLKFDISEIILEGKTFSLDSDAEKFSLIVEMGKFVRNNGFCGGENNIANVLKDMDKYHSILFLEQLSVEQMTYALEQKCFYMLRNDVVDEAELDEAPDCESG